MTSSSSSLARDAYWHRYRAKLSCAAWVLMLATANDLRERLVTQMHPKRWKEEKLKCHNNMQPLRLPGKYTGAC